MRKVIMAVAALALVAGCVESPEMTDAEWINELVANSDHCRASDLDGTGNPASGCKSGEDIPLPEHWFRQLTTESSPELILENDPVAGVCTVTVINQLEAELIIDTVWDGVFDPGSKVINDTRYVRLIVERDENEMSHGGWHIVSVTPAEHMLTYGEQEVFISSMTIYKEDQLIWACTDPGEFYRVDSQLPRLFEGDLVRMEATIDHLNPMYDPPFFVIAHGPLSDHSRHLMYDNGLYGDKTADDGIFTYEWYVEYTGRWQRIAVDVIDGDTFADQIEENYDSGAWGIRFLN
ncbi:MAG: hypothetical protein KAH54_10835 [Candidatus Sabulitectum sp.]|nr:hypothetical protein [Candidatus Sabulitectum sp.]